MRPEPAAPEPELSLQPVQSSYSDEADGASVLEAIAATERVASLQGPLLADRPKDPGALARDPLVSATLPATVDTPDRRLYDLIRRLVDTAIAALALLVFAIPIMVIALLIKIDSRGPAFFRQNRIGQHGRPFRIVKFRTMQLTAPAYSYKVRADDPRITRVGRFLRRAGLDELPQLWNVVRGEMRLIGPRPEQPFIVDNYAPWQRARLAIPPGITGWWQVHHRTEVPMHLNLDFDLHYIRNRCLALDLQIVWLTLKTMVAGILNRSP